MSLLRTVLGRWMAPLARIEEINDETTINLGAGVCVAAVCIARHSHGLDDWDFRRLCVWRLLGLLELSRRFSGEPLHFAFGWIQLGGRSP